MDDNSNNQDPFNDPFFRDFFNRLNKNGFDDLFNEMFKNMSTDPSSQHFSNLTSTSGSDGNSRWEEKTWTSDDGSTFIRSFTRVVGDGATEESDVDKLHRLQKELNAALAIEKYEVAAKLRDEMNALKEKMNNKQDNENSK